MVADFLKATLPWVAIGIALAIFFAFRSPKEKIQNNKEHNKEQ